MPIKFCNTANLSNIQVLATRQQFNGQTTPHNPYVVGNNWAVIASYQDGLQIYNISTPSNPTLAGYFDTYPQGGGNISNYGNDAYAGLWGAYPYLPSKNIVALDMSNGLFMLRFPPLVTSINENTLNASQYLLYPNPAQTKVTLNIPSQQKENMKVSVMSVDGKTIYEKEIQGTYYSHETYERIDVSGFPSGMYFVNLSTNTQTFFTQKLTVNH